MKVKTLFLATAILSMATGVALAQQSGNPSTTTGAQPSSGEMGSAPGTMSSPSMTKQKTVSPASPKAGAVQEK
jgi:hypothetical protein